MSDLIRRQDAIDAVKHAWAKGLEPSQYIKMMPSTEPERKWIPVSERLPENNKDVLVYGVEAISNEYVYGVKRLDVDTWRPKIAPSIRWVAWMPLPEPYRGE